MGVATCYDLRFPELFRGLSQRGMEVLLFPSAFTAATGKDHWHVLVRARAIENQCYAVGVNRVGTDGNGILYSGDSMVVDPMGEIVETEAHEEKLLTYTLTLQKLTNVRSKLPFLKDADPFIIGS